MLSASAPLSRLLDAAREGDAAALNHIFSLVYDELRRLARLVRQGRASETLNTTALVHEAYDKLAGAEQIPADNRLHFMRIAARAMRQVLVNAAEHRRAVKRGGGIAAATFNEEVYAEPLNPGELLALHEALERLEQFDSRQAQIVECRYFAGLTLEETASAMGISVPTVSREWRMARAWLARSLSK